MNISHCKHLRVRNSSDYNMDIEEFIKSIEMQFKIDFTSLPQWRELIEIMNIVQTDYKIKLQNAANRKYQILQNIFIQNSRLTPFELTDKFARTSKFWRNMKLNLKKHKSSESKDQPFIKSSDDNMNGMQEIVGEVSTNESQAHPNTEEIQSNDEAVLDEKQDTDLELKSLISPRLPVNICTNQHKIISSLGSNYTPFISPKVDRMHTELISINSVKEDHCLQSETKLIKSYPNKIIITNNTTKKQSMKIYLTNCCTEYLHLKFEKISDCSYFRNVKVYPYTPIKLYSGLTVTLNLTYSLKNKNDDNVSSSLHFRISRNVLNEFSEEVLIIPILSSFIKSRTISVTESVYIPANYSWHITPKLGYPKSVVHIKNTDDACYYLHIRKKYVDYSKELGESIKSDDGISPGSESLAQRMEDKEIELQSTILSTPNTKQISIHLDEVISDDNDLVSTDDIVELVVNDIIALALEPFIFKQTYLRIPPRSRKFVIVYFTKVHHVGCHQSCYDFTFNDSENADIIITKTIKVFAEVLPHPIVLQPKIFDMSKSPVSFGYWEDYFTITNSHKIFPVTIEIKTTTKMKKIFNISPMKTLVPAQSNVKFYVKKCGRKSIKESIESDDLAYFTIKILIIGHKSVYRNVPPIFYEIIAPCGTDNEFKRVYGTKYFTDIVDSSEINVSYLPDTL